jgi:hypothetical protein
MITIKEILDSLKASDRTALDYAFENDLPCTVEYKPGKYIGVNTEGMPNLVVEASAGKWNTGILKGSATCK